ncbi:MAG: hypothetical protein H7062_02595 [Candidatus Saccharimonas sp.]|nr:hypothetical protein [Planctomycetaceae bacterium]
MSDRPPVSESQSPTPPGKKPRSPVERVIVWGGIAILLGVLAFEARQKYSYDPTVGQLRKVFSEETEKYVKLSEIRPMIAGSPSEVKTPHERRSYQRIDLKWPSLFKDYRVQLIVESEGDDPLVAGFTTPGANDPDSEPVAPPTASTELAHAGPPTPAGGMMPMAGAGMGGPGGRGAGRPGAAGRPGGGSGGGPGAAVGGGGAPRGRGLVAIAQREEVVAELKLTEEQTAKLTELQAGARGAFQTLQGMPEDERAAAMKTMREGQEKSVSEILDEPQFARLLQLVWRETGLASVERDDVAKGLGLSDEQREKFRPILADRQSGQRELRDAPPEVAAQKRKEWDDQLRAVLTEEQAKQWEELLGAPAPEPAKAAASATN